jgi:UDPglucose--hexose-1-phosphate uridylyltransferase
MTLTRTSRRLADGREIIYFDDSPDAPERTAEDTRSLGARAASGEIRWDALVGDWVAVAGHRSNRTFLPPKDECPLCPSGTGSVPSEVPEAAYDVVVFENRFPSYSPVSGREPNGPEGDMIRMRPALGRCEVVCFTSNHDSTFDDLTPERARTVIDAWADRTAELGAVPEIEQVFCFENRGQEIGVTLNHPHGQIYAYPYVPQRSAALLERAAAHHARTGRLLGADILATELEAKERVVVDTEHWTAYVPFAARWRCTSLRAVTCRTCHHCPLPNATTSRTSTSSSCGGWTATTSPRTAARSGCPTSPAGTRPRPAGVATCHGSTSR